jgi:hypothetical protein
MHIKFIQILLLFVFIHFCSKNLLLDYLKLILPPSLDIGPLKLAIGRFYEVVTATMLHTETMNTHIVRHGQEKEMRTVIDEIWWKRITSMNLKIT